MQALCQSVPLLGNQFLGLYNNLYVETSDENENSSINQYFDTNTTLKYNLKKYFNFF